METNQPTDAAREELLSQLIKTIDIIVDSGHVCHECDVNRGLGSEIASIKAKLKTSLTDLLDSFAAKIRADTIALIDNAVVAAVADVKTELLMHINLLKPTTAPLTTTAQSVAAQLAAKSPERDPEELLRNLRNDPVFANVNKTLKRLERGSKVSLADAINERIDIIRSRGGEDSKELIAARDQQRANPETAFITEGNEGADDDDALISAYEARIGLMLRNDYSVG